MNKERPIYCSLSGAAFQKPRKDCVFMAAQETYGDSIAIRLACTTHEGGQAVISLKINTKLEEIKGMPARFRELEVED